MKGWKLEGDNVEVERLEPGVFQVRHYPNYTTRVPCCTVTVKVNAGDRAKAIPEADPHGLAAALARADRAIERNHQTRGR